MLGEGFEFPGPFMKVGAVVVKLGHPLDVLSFELATVLVNGMHSRRASESLEKIYGMNDVVMG